MTDNTDLLEVIKELIERKNADGCVNCAFESVEEWELPCCKCKRACKDYYRIKSELKPN